MGVEAAFSSQLSALSYQKEAMQDFKNLKVWQRSHALALEVYRITSRFPREEIYGLTSQVRRSATSISANIAEGCCRGSEPDFARFLYIAMGSASELECHVLLARDLGFLSQADAEKLVDGVTEPKRMISSLIKRLKADS
jgi:four helix bundle protein